MASTNSGCSASAAAERLAGLHAASRSACATRCPLCHSSRKVRTSSANRHRPSSHECQHVQVRTFGRCLDDQIGENALVTSRQRSALLSLWVCTQRLAGQERLRLFPKDQATPSAEKDRDVLQTGRLLEVQEEPIRLRMAARKWLHTLKVGLI